MAMSTGRVEAFSDGVLAVAITLLVLDLHAEPGSESLWNQLRDNWPSYAAYVVSFFVIGVIWVNHHALFSLAARVDRAVQFYNLVLLLFVTTIPFTTSVLASYLREGGANTRVAVLLYGLSNEGMAVGFTLILHRLIKHDLLRQPVSAAQGRVALRRFGFGVAVYPFIALVGLWAPIVMLVLYAVLTGYYVVDRTPILPEQAPAID